MGRNPAFGRPGALDRLQLWWYAKDRSSRVNTLLCLAVGVVAVCLFAAALTRDTAGSTGLANATRPQLTPPSTVDLRAAGEVAIPLAPPDQPSSTSSSVLVAPTVAPTAPASSAAPARPPPGVSTTAVRPVATTVPTLEVIFTQVPPVSSTAPPPVTTTAPPPTSTSVVPPSTAPPTSATPTTAVTLLPQLPLDVPPLLPGP